MTSNDPNPRAWTPDLLAQGPEKRRVFIEQCRQRLAPLMAMTRQLAGEIDADLAERPGLYGDLPWSPAMRAHKTAKPFAAAVEDLESFLEHLTTYAARYTALYEELPEQRAGKEKHKREVAALKAGKAQQQIEGSQPKAESGPAADSNPFFEHLKRGA